MTHIGSNGSQPDDELENKLKLFRKRLSLVEGTQQDGHYEHYYGRKRDQVYLYIKRKIQSRELQPGQLIDAQRITEELRVSRTPIQEAFTRLEQEGFIKMVPQVGVFVRTSTSNELFEKLLSRAVLEGVLAEWASKRIGDEELQMLEELIQLMESRRLSVQQYSLLNREFHNVIHLTAGLSHIRMLVELQWDLVDYTTSTDILFKPENMRLSLEEHMEILEHLRNRRPLEARRAMEAHGMRVANLFRGTAD